MVVDKTYLLRNEIARLIGSDPKLVRAYEELQRAALESLPELIEDAQLSLESLDARVDVVEDALSEGATLLQDEDNPVDFFHTLNLKGEAVSGSVAAGVAELDVNVSDGLVAELGGDPGADASVIWDNSAGGLAFGDAPGSGGGDIEFIGRTTVTTLSNVDIPLSSTYDSFDIEFYLKPSNDIISVTAVVTDDNFATVKTGATDYSYNQHRAANGAAGVTSSSGAANIAVIASQGNDTNEYNAGIIRIVNSKESGAPTEIVAHFKYVTNAGVVGLCFLEASYKPNTVLNGLRISPSAGTYTGFFKVWGRTA